MSIDLETGATRFGVTILRKPLSLIYKILRVFSEVLTSVELPCEARVGRRLLIEHAFDIVVSGDAVLGDDVVLRNGVTIGLRHRGHRGSPTIGNRVDIGAGAKLLGPISIGDDVAIGANAVVLTDVPGWTCRCRSSCSHPTPLVAGFRQSNSPRFMRRVRHLSRAMLHKLSPF